MEKVVEIEFLGRGGQGGKTAAFIYAQSAMYNNWHIKAFPEYGPERAGAPVKAFVRLSNQPIRLHNHVYNPDYLAILDMTLIESHLDLIKDVPFVILNATKEVSHTFVNKFKGKIYFVDASKISLEEIGKNYPNVVMLGALEKVTGFSNLDNLKLALRKISGRKWDEVVLKRNIAAIERGFNEVVQLK